MAIGNNQTRIRAVRGMATNLEFDRAVDRGELTGLQGFVTFTRAY